MGPVAFYKKTIRDIDLNDKTVLLRVDFNVPINDHGVISDDYRLRQTLPTIEHLRGLGAKIVITSHLGRPSGPHDKSASLAPVAARLSDLLHLPVEFVDNCVGKESQDAKKNLQAGGILMLENVRFHPEEEANDAEFAKQLAENCDVFVQDCFGVAHREHASIVAVTQFLPSVAGLLLEREVDTITKAMEDPERPLAVVIGGAKISDKIELLEKFVETADFVAVVGAMANTFLLAEGYEVGKSLVEKDAVHTAKEVLKKGASAYAKRAIYFLLAT